MDVRPTAFSRIILNAIPALRNTDNQFANAGVKPPRAMAVPISLAFTSVLIASGCQMLRHLCVQYLVYHRLNQSL